MKKIILAVVAVVMILTGFKAYASIKDYCNMTFNVQGDYNEQVPAINKSVESFGGDPLIEEVVIGSDVSHLATTSRLYSNLHTGRNIVYAYEFVAAGSSTNAIRSIGPETDQIDFEILALESAGVTAQLKVKIYESNDPDCSTANTATSSGIATTDINWYDFAPQSSTSNHQITLEDDITEYLWTLAGKASSTKITLSDWNADCIKFDIAAVTATSTISVKMKTKELN